MNMATQKRITEEISDLLKALGHPTRLEILLEIGLGEACVCHLEAALGQRQAYISQHLMVLREMDLLDSRQEGRYVFYQLRDPEILTLIHEVRKMLGLPALPERGESTCDCPCPKCHAT